ncbi:MAG: hypothetical protein D6785_08260, partial [Planctomycetota bacterium]
MHKKFYAKLFGSALAPLAQGASEALGGMVGEKVVHYLKSHFQSSKRLSAILSDSYRKGLDTLEIAFRGPSFYHQKANKEFAAAFQAEVLQPFLFQSKMEEGPFREGVQKDLQFLRSLDLTPEEAFSADELAQTVGGFAVESASLWQEKMEESTESLVSFLKEKTPPPHYLASLLSYRNLLTEAISLHFSRAVEEDEFLFRHYFLCHAKGLDLRLKEIQKALEKSRTEKNRELFKKLNRQKALFEEVKTELEFGLRHISQEMQDAVSSFFSRSESHFGRLFTQLEELQETIVQEGAKTREELEAMKKMLDEIRQAISRIQKSKRISQKANLFSYFLGLSEEEKSALREIRSKAAQLPSSFLTPSLLRDLATLMTMAGDEREGRALFDQALSRAQELKEEKEEARIHYDRFISQLHQTPPNLSQALESYRKSLSFSPEVTKELEFFETWKYEALEILGVGGFGIAFLCRDRQLEEKVVIKAILDEFTDAERAIQEAKNIHNLRSSYMVQLKDYGYLEPYRKKRAYLIMEYFPGMDLEKWIEKKGAFSIERGLDLALAIAHAMETAHKKGILHRDLKPANILYRETEEGFEIKIIDFGLALKDERLLQNRSLQITLVSRRGLLEESLGGTLDYASPEQLGRIPAQIGPWSDIYSFGRTLKKIFFASLKPHGKIIRAFPKPELYDFICDCESDDPRHRPRNFQEVISK